MAEVTTHACRNCKKVLPATTDFFYRAGGHFNWQCKPCRIAYAGEWKRKRYSYTGFVDRPCEHCGRVFTTAKRGARHCTLECHVAARHEAEKAARLAAKVASPRTCPRCGRVLDPARTLRAKFCSTRCAERAHAQTRKFRRRSGATSTRAAGEPLISLVYFHERDGGRCGICRKRVDLSLGHPDPSAPSLDHIVPPVTRRTERARQHPASPPSLQPVEARPLARRATAPHRLI